MTAKKNDGPTLTLQVCIREEDIENLLISAFEAGIGYWACIVDYESLPGAEMPRRSMLPLVPGGAVVLAAKEVGNRLILDREAVKRGLRIMFEKHPVHFGNFISNKADAGTADVFVQCCLFGHVVYG